MTVVTAAAHDCYSCAYPFFMFSILKRNPNIRFIAFAKTGRATLSLLKHCQQSPGFILVIKSNGKSNRVGCRFPMGE